MQIHWLRKIRQQEASNEAAENWKIGVQSKLIKNYQSCKIFNSDETGLLYWGFWENTLMFENESAAGNKNFKD